VDKRGTEAPARAAQRKAGSSAGNNLLVPLLEGILVVLAIVAILLFRTGKDR
jgi:hypothetical protein